MKKRYKTLVLLCALIVLAGCTAQSPVSSEPPTPEGADYVAEEHYVDTFGEGYTYTGESETVFEDRHFRLEDLPENEAEELVARNYYDEISSEDSGFQEYSIHDLSTMTWDEVKALGEFFTAEVEEDTAECQLAEFAVIQADVTWAYTEEKLALGPQLEEGRYQRGFLCGKKNVEDDWVIYEVYWLELFA